MATRRGNVSAVTVITCKYLKSATTKSSPRRLVLRHHSPDRAGPWFAVPEEDISEPLPVPLPVLGETPSQ
jgi:hypothetical protein